MTRRGLVTHILYGENTYLFSGRGRAWARRRGNRLVATFHQPPEILRRAGPSEAALKRLDKVITLCRAHASFFESIVGPERVARVPLGVDTDYFTPAVAPALHSTPTCLVVGRWRRDATTLAEAAALLGNEGVHVRVVSPSRRVADAVQGTASVTVLPRLSDAALREEYRRSHVLLLPLKETPTSGALLEGMACGLPPVVSDVGGVKEYVTRGSGVIVPPGDPDTMARSALRLIEDRRVRATLSQAARTQSLTFSWPRVVTQLLREYASLY